VPMKSHRKARVAEVIRQVAAETILFQFRDPRVKMVTVIRAEVSGDLQNAKVYVSIMGSERDQRIGLHALQHAAGFVQSKLADRMKTRFIPLITFVLDEGLKNSINVMKLLQAERQLNGEEEIPSEEVVDNDDDDLEDEEEVEFEEGSTDSKPV
jgi:ribosome-binding factor A